MTTTTSLPNFDAETEALDVASTFAGQIKGKTILITGVNVKGIGFATAEAFASQSPQHLIITGRSPSKIHDSIEALKHNYPDVKYIGLKLDLSRQQSVREAAREVLSWTEVPTIDIIINSAGVMMLPERELSEDWIEMHFATNHIGHFLFTSLIMEKLLKAAGKSEKGAVRVINLTSLSPTWSAIRWSDINFDKVNKTLPEVEQPPYAVHKAWGFVDPPPETGTYLPLEGYNQSKVANVLFSVGLNRRLYDTYGILSFAVHPGVIFTELGRNMSKETLDAVGSMMESGRFEVKSTGAGAATGVVAALDPKLGLPLREKGNNGKENHGVYFIDCQVSDQARDLAVSSEEAEKLWKLSEELVKEQFAF